MLHDEQWGSRPNRTSTDAAMQKMLIFEYGRYMKFTIALFANDQTACFDRMWPELSNTVAYAVGVDKQVLKCRALTIEAMQRHIKTGLGVSKKSYGNTPNEPRIIGEIQGKGDVATLWAFISSTLLLAHSLLWTGLDLPSSTGGPGLKRNNAGYVDDVDTMAGSTEYGPEATHQVMHHLEVGAQKWANIQDVVAQSTAFHKCAVSALAWKEEKSSLVIDYDFKYDMILSDINGAGTSIGQLAPDKPNKGLGFYQALDGNMRAEYEGRRDKVKNMCQALTRLQPNQLDANIMLNSRLTPQTTYGMRLTSFTSKQCHSLDKLVLGAFLPSLKVNRSSPRAMVHGPIQYGGMGIVRQEALQDQWGLHNFVQTLRWDKIPAQDLTRALDAFQVASGFVTPVLASPDISIDYLGIGWIPHIRSRLAALKGSMAVEKAWQPKLQRLNDDSLMEVVASHPAITRKMRERFNEVRIFLGVTLLSELSNEEGNGIDIMRLHGDWRAQVIKPLRLPNQPFPSKVHWANFRKCLRYTFCTSTSPYKRKGFYVIDNPLGKWFARPRLIYYQCYATKDGLVWRSDSAYHPCTRTSTTNIYTFDLDTTIPLPLESHPIAVRYVAEDRFWAWRKYRPFNLPPIPEAQTVLTDMLSDEPNTNLFLVSDASVHIKTRQASGSWKMYSSKESPRKVAIPLQHLQHAHSYRLELETFWHGLNDATKRLKNPHKIRQMMDCEGGLKKLDIPITHARQTMEADMDIVLAYKHLEQSTHHTINRQWVMGHADRKKKDNPESITEFEWDNISVDSAADDCVEHGGPPMQFEPLPGYRAMLMLDGEWVTTHFRDCVDFAHNAPAMHEYAMRRLDITAREFDDIDWACIGKVRQKHQINRIVRTSKMMYRWLPVGHNWQKCKLHSDKCPCCRATDETFQHLMCCENDHLAAIRKEAISSFRTMCNKMKIPTNFADFFVKVIHAAMKNTIVEQTTNDYLNTALKAQEQIGMYHLLVGFISITWQDALVSMGVEHPHKKMEAILSFLWDDFCEPIWFMRNEILHSTVSHVSTDDMMTLADRLLWYLRHQDEVLDYRHRFLVDYDENKIHHWSRDTRRQKVTMLDNARHWYTNECNTRAQSQTTITNWFDKYMTLRSGKLVGRGIDNARMPPTDNVGYETEEFEFEWDNDPPPSPATTIIRNTAPAVSPTRSVESSVVRTQGENT